MGTRSEVVDTHTANVMARRRMKSELMEFVPATGYQVTSEHPPVLIAAPASAINMRLPAASSELRGLTFYIYNQSGATSVITLQDSVGGAFNPAITIPITSGRMVICNGATWRQVI